MRVRHSTPRTPRGKAIACGRDGGWSDTEAGAALLGVDLGLEDADIGHIPVLLAVVQAIAHHKLVGDLEAGIVGGDGLFAAGGLIQ